MITRDATKLAVGQVWYTPWCDEHGKVIDDGTVHRIAEDEFFWTAADPQYRWLSLNARGLDVAIEDVTETVAAVALQGPFARAVLEEAHGGAVWRAALLPAGASSKIRPRAQVDRHRRSRARATPATSATSCGSPSSARPMPGTP